MNIRDALSRLIFRRRVLEELVRRILTKEVRMITTVDCTELKSSIMTALSEHATEMKHLGKWNIAETSLDGHARIATVSALDVIAKSLAAMAICQIEETKTTATKSKSINGGTHQLINMADVGKEKAVSAEERVLKSVEEIIMSALVRDGKTEEQARSWLENAEADGRALTDVFQNQFDAGKLSPKE